MLRNLCGEHFLKNVVLVSTFWDTPPTENQLVREKELRENFWDATMKAGTRTAPFPKFNTVATGRVAAQNIIRILLGNNPMALQVQEEVVDKNMDIHQTSAGKAVNAELERMANTFKVEMEQCEADTAKNKDGHMEKIVDLEQQNAQILFEKVEGQRAIMAQYSAEWKRMQGQSAQAAELACSRHFGLLKRGNYPPLPPFS